MMDIITPAFTKSLPKIELHAHLTGSITRECLHEIWMQRKLEQPDLGLRDPLEAIADDKIWDVMTFFPLFSSYIYELCSTIPSLVYSTNAVLRDFKDDGVVYLELRTTPRSSATISKDKYVETVLSCINDFPDRESMPTYLILSIDRRNTAEQAMEVIDLAIRYRTRGIVGVDLCGDPSKGDVSTFREAFVKAKQHGLKITLHFAETPASSSALELDTLLDYQPDRVGHVIHVSKEMQKEIIRKGIGVELCVSCNVQAKLIRGEVEDHHFGFWRDADCSVALCTDDVGVFRSTLSNEYLLVAKSFGLNKNHLLGLCRKGIEGIFGGETEKQRLRSIIIKLSESLTHAYSQDIQDDAER